MFCQKHWTWELRSGSSSWQTINQPRSWQFVLCSIHDTKLMLPAWARDVIYTYVSRLKFLILAVHGDVDFTTKIQTVHPDVFLRATVVHKAMVPIPGESRTAWWRHRMETFSALLAMCAGNSPVTGEFPAQRPVTRSFDVFFDLRPNERLSQHSWGWWLETPSSPLWRHSNGIPVSKLRKVIYRSHVQVTFEL